MIEFHESVDFKKFAYFIVGRVELMQAAAYMQIRQVFEAVLLNVKLGQAHHLARKGQISNVFDFVLVENEFAKIPQRFQAFYFDNFIT